MIPLVLASGSPRRKELLGQLGIPLAIDVPAVDEAVLEGEAPADFARRVSTLKGEAVARRRPADVIVAADTCVVLGEHILNKPADEEDAARMVLQLAGKTHEVLTGVYVRGPKGVEHATVATRVRFRALTEAEARWYAHTGEPLDKAGAYAIQGKGGAFVAAIEGSYSNVVGLPLAETLALLARVGYRLPWEAP